MSLFRTNDTLERLNQILDDTMSGTFEESRYDESQLSRLESKWMRYLTSSQRSLRKVEEERASIKELVTDISHQTKTPLSNIMLYSQLLQEQAQEEDSKKLAEQIHRQSEKLQFLIQALIKTSRLESGTFQIQPQKNKVFPMIQEIMRESEGKAGAKQITISNQVNETMIASFDKKWTAEALFNILDNAVKYSSPGSQVKLTAESYEMYAAIRIIDEGPGIAEEEIPRIFGRFYRGEDAHLEEGIGIGLYLSRQIIEAQSGYITVRSQLGKGSEFQVYLLR